VTFESEYGSTWSLASLKTVVDYEKVVNHLKQELILPVNYCSNYSCWCSTMADVTAHASGVKWHYYF
jgi:hypothetical protein